MDKKKIFMNLHKAGLVSLLIRFFRPIRKMILESVDYNTDLITPQLTRLDMLTDGNMHRFPKLKKFYTKGGAEVALIGLENTLMEFTGFKNILTVAQGRQAEWLLAEEFCCPGKCVITNGLFASTYENLAKSNIEIIELREDSAVNNESHFGGNLNIDALTREFQKKDRVGFVYIESCNNALGGLPFSFKNYSKVSEICKANAVPLVIDGTRILQNAVLIKQYEPGFEKYTPVQIARMIFDLTDACTISCSKEMLVDNGGILGFRDSEKKVSLGDKSLLLGDGLSLYAKARLSYAYSKGLKQAEKAATKKVKSIKKGVEALYKKGLPVVNFPGGVGIYLNINELMSLKLPNPDRAFLAKLYEEYGILGIVNYTTPVLVEGKVYLLRFALTPENCHHQRLQYFVKSLIKAWNQKDKLTGLIVDYQPGGKAGKYFARYKPVEISKD